MTDLTMTLSETILTEIRENPGITSPEICEKFPSLKKGTITSKISKLKARHLIYSEEPANKFHSVKLYILHRVDRECPVEEVSVVETLDYSKEEVLQVLKPLADFAKKMQANGLPSQVNVWMSATTENPTVFVAPGDWFFDALALMKKLA